VLGQRTGKAIAREELFRLGVILRRGTSDNVFEGNGEFVSVLRVPRAEPPLALLRRRRYRRHPLVTVDIARGGAAHSVRTMILRATQSAVRFYN
jgi:hypothetical protein